MTLPSFIVLAGCMFMAATSSASLVQVDAGKLSVQAKDIPLHDRSIHLDALCATIFLQATRGNSPIAAHGAQVGNIEFDAVLHVL